MLKAGQQLYLGRAMVLVEATSDEACDSDGPYFTFKVLESDHFIPGTEGIASLDQDTWRIAWTWNPQG